MDEIVGKRNFVIFNLAFLGAIVERKLIFNINYFCINFSKIFFLSKLLRQFNFIQFNFIIFVLR